jgi:hypothetical protein
MWWLEWYSRDRAARWRYKIDGALVPGAKDLRLRHICIPTALNDDWVEVNSDLIHSWPALNWARNHAANAPVPRYNGGVAIARDEWELNRDTLIGLTAPELSVAMMLNTKALASLLGIQPKTVSAYVTRGYLVGPTFNSDRHPLWSVPVLTRHLRKSREARRERERRAEQRRTTTPPSKTTTTLRIDEIDAILARLGIDLDDD